MLMTSIVSKPDTCDELKRFGCKEQTYDDIVNELLKKAKESVNATTLTNSNRSK